MIGKYYLLSFIEVLKYMHQFTHSKNSVIEKKWSQCYLIVEIVVKKTTMTSIIFTDSCFFVVVVVFFFAIDCLCHLLQKDIFGTARQPIA